jgi:hypothetical protein
VTQCAWNRHGTVPPHPCVLYASGSIGQLACPYKECTIWSPIGLMVTFVASGPGANGGLVYTDRPLVSFADECTRHLVGDWRLFAPSTDSNGDPGSCYIGPTLRGGGCGSRRDSPYRCRTCVTHQWWRPGGHPPDARRPGFARQEQCNQHICRWPASARPRLSDCSVRRTSMSALSLDQSPTSGQPRGLGEFLTAVKPFKPHFR